MGCPERDPGDAADDAALSVELDVAAVAFLWVMIPPCLVFGDPQEAYLTARYEPRMFSRAKAPVQLAEAETAPQTTTAQSSRTHGPDEEARGPVRTQDRYGPRLWGSQEAG